MNSRWTKSGADGPALDIRPGPELLEARQVYFEDWAIESLTKELSREADLRRWISPRILPQVHIDGRILYKLSKRPLRLTAEQTALLAACDGQRTAEEITNSLIADPSVRLSSPAQVQRMLEKLCRMGILVREGMMYAGRGLVYEDCRRNARIHLGPDVLEPLGPPLALVLASARWLVGEITRTLNSHLLGVYDSLKTSESASVDCYHFFCPGELQSGCRRRKSTFGIRGSEKGPSEPMEPSIGQRLPVGTNAPGIVL